MPPKRRDKEATDSNKNHRGELCQADHELFLQAFEKPTQIYRFLRSRNMLCPIFLNRTLTYMHSRMSRSNKGRKTFKINNMLERLEKAQSQNNGSQPLPGFMTLTFLGCYDKTDEKHAEPVKVETLLLKICHKKRKDVSCPAQTKSLGVSLVAHNPSDECPPPKVPALSIPTECFSLTDQANQAKSYHLLLRVRMPAPPPATDAPLALPSTPATDLDSADPPQKKRKLNKDEEGMVAEEGEEGSRGVWLEYGTDLIVYDKQNRCQLSDGDYELVLEPLTPGSKISHTLCCWESIGPIKEVEEGGDHLCSSFKQFRMCPVIKFHLRWSREPVSKFVHRPSNPFSLPMDDTLDSNSNKENFRPEKDEAGVGGGGGKMENRLQIVYQFLYNNNSRQQTEACEDLHCPWCSLDCSALYSLLKHLKLCHSRFTFTYVPIPGGARIDVAINEYYDGSYSGCPQDLICQPPGLAFSRAGPVRRTCVSYILVCHPKRSQPSLSEFLELDENEFDGQRPYITGHNRLYHHTTTCLPVYPKEMEIDSEDENDPKWLQTKTMMMIDDFTDVNEGEKELMKMWNLHVMRHGYVGDCQIPLACTMFLQAKGQELLKKNLYRNFVLHMCSLFDFGLVSPVTVYTTIQRLQELVVEGGDASKILQESCEAQREHWVAEGASKAAEPRRTVAATVTPVQGTAERRKPKRPVSPQPSKKKPNVIGKPVVDNNKRKLVEKLNDKEKCETVSKKKTSVGGAVVAVPKTSNTTQNKERESALAAVSLRRKSSTTAETNNPVVLLRRKSFAGATEALRKKTLENGVSNGIVGVNHKSGVS